jgi:methyl-accepting chemotaxis protein
MQAIVLAVQRVTGTMGEIREAASDQLVDITEVNCAVSELDQMTQQNSALVEESAAAAESLRDQAVRLSEICNRFNLGSGEMRIIR